MTEDQEETRAQQEIERLWHDTGLVLAALTELGRQHPVETPTPTHADYYHVAGDLWLKLVEHNRAVAVLLRSGLFSPALVVHRAAYEVLVNLGYLIKQGDRLENALLYRARSLLEVAEQFASEASGISAAEVLTRMPQKVVEEAKRHQRKNRPWSGRWLGEMATDIGVVGHKWFYAITSWEAHGRVAGYDVTETAVEGTDLRRMDFRSPAPAKHREALANHARRNLHKGYQLVARDWYGTVPPLATTDDPFAASEDARVAPETQP